MNMFSFKKNSVLHKGFTLVETLVAISILSLAILSTFTAVQQGLHTSTYAKDQITAFYLIQEGMEFIRNIRDENALKSIQSTGIGGSPVYWLHGIAENASDACYFGKTCMIDSPEKLILTCPNGSGSCPNLREDTMTGLYGYFYTWPQSRFSREIQLESINSDEVKVTIVVSWIDGEFTRSFRVQETLFNIRT